jgi:catechol 2,3-dioxygenase-like lactoylglutathione lyase family enzyme
VVKAAVRPLSALDLLLTRWIMAARGQRARYRLLGSCNGCGRCCESPSEAVNAAPVTPYQGLDHFGLAVSGIDAIAADLKKKGVEFTKEPHSPRPGIKICFLRGPQGISIELLDRDPKYT